MSDWVLTTNNLKQALIEAQVVECNKNIIMWMSLKKLALYWGLAIFSILIPVLHFILVPVFLIVGVVAFFSQYKNTHFIPVGSYVCPLCSNQVSFHKTYLFEGKKLNCDICMEQMTLGRKN